MADIATLGVKVQTTGITTAASELNRLGREADSAGTKTAALGAKFGAVAGAFAGAAVIGGIAAIIHSTIEAEKAQAQLAAVLKSTGGAAGLSAVELNKMSAALQDITAFDDEAITGAQSLLLTFTKIGKDVFPKATETVLDMSQALGQDLKSSAVQLGKALNDPIQGVTALQRVGVSFSSAQKDLIKSLVETNRLAEAQGIILKELETEFGGSARAARETLGGALSGLKHDFFNLLEGDSKGDGMRGATDAINDLAETMRSPAVKDGFATIITAIANVAEYSAKAIGAIAGLGQAVQDYFSDNYQKSEQGLLAARNDAVDRIALLKRSMLERGLASAGLGTNLQEEEANLRQIDSLLKAFRQNRAREARDAERQKKAAPKGPATNTDPLGGSPDDAPAVKATAAATRDFTSAEDELLRIMREADQARMAATEQFGDMAAQLSGPLAEAERDHVKRLNDISEAGTTAGKTAEEIARVLDLENQRYDDQKKAIERDLDPIGELIKQKEEELRLMGLTESAYRTEIDLRNAGATATEEQKQKLLELNQAQINAAKTENEMNTLRESFADSFADVISGTKSAADAFKDFADSIIQQIARIIAEQAAAKLFGAGGNDTGSIGGIFSSFFSSLFGGGRAAGGPVAGNRLYEVAEQGAPEMFTANGKSYLIPGANGKVTPLKGGANGGGGNTTHININVPGGTSRETAQQIATKVQQALVFAGRAA